jgi:hypothetical protein
VEILEDQQHRPARCHRLELAGQGLERLRLLLRWRQAQGSCSLSK